MYWVGVAGSHAASGTSPSHVWHVLEWLLALTRPELDICHETDVWETIRSS